VNEKPARQCPTCREWVPVVTQPERLAQLERDAAELRIRLARCQEKHERATKIIAMLAPQIRDQAREFTRGREYEREALEEWIRRRRARAT